MLEPSFCEAHIPTMTQPKGTDPLGERAFNTCSLILLCFPCRCTLLLSEYLQCFVFALWLQRHMAGIRLGFGTS